MFDCCLYSTSPPMGACKGSGERFETNSTLTVKHQTPHLLWPCQYSATLRRGVSWPLQFLQNHWLMVNLSALILDIHHDICQHYHHHRRHHKDHQSWSTSLPSSWISIRWTWVWKCLPRTGDYGLYLLKHPVHYHFYYYYLTLLLLPLLVVYQHLPRSGTSGRKQCTE